MTDRASAEGPAFERKRRPKSYAATGRASDAMSQVRRASAEGLRAALDDLFDAINVVIGEDEEPEYLKPYVKRVRAALRDTGPRPDSDAVLLANAILGGSSYLPHREAAERILARDTAYGDSRS